MIYRSTNNGTNGPTKNVGAGTNGPTKNVGAIKRMPNGPTKNVGAIKRMLAFLNRHKWKLGIPLLTGAYVSYLYNNGPPVGLADVLIRTLNGNSGMLGYEVYDFMEMIKDQNYGVGELLKRMNDNWKTKGKEEQLEMQKQWLLAILKADPSKFFKVLFQSENGILLLANAFVVR